MPEPFPPEDDSWDPHGTLRPDRAEHLAGSPPPSQPDEDVGDNTLALPNREEAVEQARALHRKHVDGPQNPSPSDRTVNERTEETLAGNLENRPFDSASAQVGQQFGDYELLSIIAKGGMGVVYKARQQTLNRIVAVKMILAGQLADDVDVERFRTEAEAAARLTHPHIVAVHEIGQVGGQHFFSMEYVDGQSLADLVRESPMSPENAATYVRDIALAMDYAHSHGILHRDLKPSNVLVNAEGQPRITDFGLAKRVEENSQLTMTGMIVGTPSYMPPEQAVGNIAEIGVRSDVYSTGAILYELLTGGPPFRSATPFETIRQVLDVDPVSPRTVNPSVPQDLETICLKALQKDPSSRYATEKELADELDRFLRGLPILARPLGFPARALRWMRRNPLVAGWAGAAALLLASTLAATTIGYFQTKAALKDSQNSLRQALDVVDTFCTRVSEDALLNQPGLQPVRRDLLREAMQYLANFAEQKNDRSLDFELAKSHYRIGLITEEIESAEDAVPWLENAIRIQTRLYDRHTDDTKNAAALGETWNAIGRIRNRMRDPVGVRAAYRNAIRYRTEAFENKKDPRAGRVLANSHMNMGIFERQNGDLPSARNQMKLAQSTRASFLREESTAHQSPDEKSDIVKIKRDYAKGCYNLGVLESFAGNPDEGKAHLLDAIARFEELVELDPSELSHLYFYATSHRVFGDLQVATGDPAAASHAYERARETLRTLAEQNETVLEYQVSLAELIMSLGGLQSQQASHAKAIKSFQEAIAVLNPLTTNNPEVPRYRCNLAVAKRELAATHATARNAATAWPLLRESESLLNKLVTELPDEEEYQVELQSTIETIGWLQSFAPEGS